ncbi:MAG: hypothetical protein Q6K12_08320, partial [Gloeomargarita sp. DG_1_6_bins_138]
EFACLTLGLSPQRAYEFGQTLRQGIGDYPVSLSSELVIPVTVTLGGVVFTQNDNLDTEQVWQQVQTALAKAQSLGVNQLVLLGYEPHPA